MAAPTAEMVVDGLLASEVCLAPDGRQVAFVAAPVGQHDRFKMGLVGAGPTDWGMMVTGSDVPLFQGRLGAAPARRERGG
jgi:hypothetical protein